MKQVQRTVFVATDNSEHDTQDGALIADLAHILKDAYDASEKHWDEFDFTDIAVQLLNAGYMITPIRPA